MPLKWSKRAIGVDKGYTDVLTDSDGEQHGQGLGDVLSQGSDRLKKKYQNAYVF